MNPVSLSERIGRMRPKSGGGIVEYPGHATPFAIATLRVYGRVLSAQLDKFLEENELEGMQEMEKALARVEEPQEQSSVVQSYRSGIESKALDVQRYAWSTFATLVWANFESSMDLFRIWVENSEPSTNAPREPQKRSNRPPQGIRRLNCHLDYFQNCNVNIRPVAEMDYLCGLYLVRNTIVHANGLIDRLDKETDRTDLVHFIKEEDGLSREPFGFEKHGLLCVHRSFSIRALEVTEAFLNKLNLAVESRYFASDASL